MTTKVVLEQIADHTAEGHTASLSRELLDNKTVGDYVCRCWMSI